MGRWKNRWIQTPQRILMDPCIKQAPVLSKRFWIIPWPLAYNRLELDCIRKIINFWYTFGWKWRVFMTIWDCRTHVHMTSMTSSIERTDLDFKISVALPAPKILSETRGEKPSTTCTQKSEFPSSQMGSQTERENEIHYKNRSLLCKGGKTHVWCMTFTDNDNAVLSTDNAN